MKNKPTLLIAFLVSLCYYNYVSAQNIWEKPTGYVAIEPLDVFFVDDNHGCIVGENGSIAVSLDGGLTWTETVNMPSNSFESVFFKDSVNGFAVGTNGIILRTDDGGSNWNIISSGLINNLHDITFSSSSDGWIAADGTILHSTDGGNTWSTSWSGINAYFQAITFVSSLQGWAVGFDGNMEAYILTTSDGGITWTNQTAPLTGQHQLLDVVFTDSQTGTIVGMNSTILRTTDAGATWTDLYPSQFSSLYGISFINSTKGLIVGDYGTILETSDGGNTWFQQNLFTNLSFRKIFTKSTGNCWVAGLGSVHLSQNFGSTWNIGYSGSGRQLYAVDFPTSTNGWAVGIDLSVLHTSDGGNTWKRQSTPGSPFWALDVDFTDSLTGWIVGTGGEILATTDGGLTWSFQNSGTIEELHGIHMLTNTTGWIVGVNGTILTTQDGITWSHQMSDIPNLNISDVHFIDNQNGFACANNGNGILLKTSDGGTNWTFQTLGNNLLIAMTFYDSLKGWIVGDLGTIYHTQDGGSTWYQQYAETNLGLNDIEFISPNQGWTVGAYSNIFVTSNGGQTWTQQNPIDSLIEFSGISFEGNQGFVVGSNGTIKKFNCTAVSLFVNSFSLPSSNTICSGILSVNTFGTGDFTSSIDGTAPFTHPESVWIHDLCPGFHYQLLSDMCGNQDSVTFIIPVDSNYVFNNPFIDSLALDSLGTTVTNCDIYYNSINTAYIDSIWATGNTVNVIWNIVDSNGSNLDTTTYVLNNGNGVYWLQLSVFCPTKALGDYFTVTQAIYFENGMATVGMQENSNIQNITIYPNPTNSYVTIAFDDSEAHLHVTDAQGKRVFTGTIHSGEQLLLEQMETGVYFFEVITEKGSVVKRIVKQ